MGGVAGHTFFSTEDTMVSLEKTPKHPFKLKKHNQDTDVVRTNHGEETEAGYRKGDDLKSSKIRKQSAEKIMNHIKDPKNILDALRKDFFEEDSNLNMNRKTKTMSTSSQVLLNVTDMIFEVNYFEDKVEEFKGIINKLPKGYEPTIKIEIKKL
jgi:hypothetical protein